MRMILFIASAIVVALYLSFTFSRPAPPPSTVKFSSDYGLTHQWGEGPRIVRLAPEPAQAFPEVNRKNKTDAYTFRIYIHDGPTGGEVTAPMGRRQAEAELKSLYADADAEILVPDGRGGYMFAPDTSKKVRHLVLGGPNN